MTKNLTCTITLTPYKPVGEMSVSELVVYLMYPSCWVLDLQTAHRTAFSHTK